MEIRQAGAQATAPRLTTVESPAAREATAWVQQFARALKTCRLYDADNSAVLRARAELAASLTRLLTEFHTLGLTVAPREIQCEAGAGLVASVSDEHLAMTFYRDGVRRLVLSEGMEPGELDTLLDIVLGVSGLRAADEDLVTLIWDAGLPHVDISYVPTDGDLEGGPNPAGRGDEWGGFAARFGSGESDPTRSGAGTPGPMRSSEVGGGIGRADERSTVIDGGAVEAAARELEGRSSEEVARYRSEYLAELKTPPARTAICLVRDCLDVAGPSGSAGDFGRFLVRPLREALGAGSWGEAAEAHALLRRCEGAAGIERDLLAELCEADSLTTGNVVSQLDGQDAGGLEKFIAFARSFGAAGADWLMHILAASEQRSVRLALTTVIADLCREQPEILIPWLADRRWYVVRNVIHILGRIGGPRIVTLLREASGHEEFRVRREVVTAATGSDAEEMRPLLIGMLDMLDTRLFCSALRRLGTRRDPELARILVAQLQAPGFGERSMEERRAIYVTLAAVGSDESVPALEAELNQGSWIQRSPDAHQRAIARCLLHLGTPRARETLEAGRRSRRRAVRKACEEVLEGSGR